MLGNFINKGGVTTPCTITSRDTQAEPSTAKINRNMSLFDGSKVCPRANKAPGPISGAVKNVSAAYLSL